MPTSKGQEYVRTALTLLLGGAPFPTIRGVLKSGPELELDGYNSELRMAFEFQGRHHYERGVFDHHGTSLEDIQKNDRIKVADCQEAGIKLIIVPYWIFENERKTVCTYLCNQLESLGIDPIESRWTGLQKVNFGSEAPIKSNWQKEIAIQCRLALFRFVLSSILASHPKGIPLPDFTACLLKKHVRPRWTTDGRSIREIEFGWIHSAESTWTAGKKFGFAWQEICHQGVSFTPEDAAHLSTFHQYALAKIRFCQG